MRLGAAGKNTRWVHFQARPKRRSSAPERDQITNSAAAIAPAESTITIQTQTGTVTLPVKDIAARTESTLSLMPEGLLESLQPREVLDLVAYLQSPMQVALPSGETGAASRGF